MHARRHRRAQPRRTGVPLSHRLGRQLDRFPLGAHPGSSGRDRSCTLTYWKRLLDPENGTATSGYELSNPIRSFRASAAANHPSCHRL
jgi:hypothetical protein